MKSRFFRYPLRVLLVVIIVLGGFIVFAHPTIDKVSQRTAETDNAEHLLNPVSVPINLYINEGMLTEPETKGWWHSPSFDLAKLANIPISSDSGTISLTNFNFYYGDVTNVDNKDNDAYSIEQLSKFDVIVTQEPGENNQIRQQAVLKGLIQNGVKVMGYVQVGPLPGEKPPSYKVIKAAIDRCAEFGYYGVFYDMCGYDYGVTRKHLNSIVNYTHSKNLIAFVNAWWPADVLDSRVDANYNPSGAATAMTADDWVLLESFYLRSDDKYAGDPEGGFIYSFDKYTVTVSLANSLGVKVCGLAYALPDTPSTDTTDWKKAYQLAVGLGLRGLSYSRSIENKMIKWTLNKFSPPIIGTSLVTPYRQIDMNTFEAKTNAGIIGFEASDKPIRRDEYSFQIPSLFKAEIQTLLPAGKYNIFYYSSPDGVAWRRQDNLMINNRFFQMRISSEIESLYHLH